MDKRNLIWGALLLALGAGFGVYWQQRERAPAAELVAVADGSPAATHALPLDAPADGQLAAKPSTSLGAQPARMAASAADDPEWQRQLAAARASLTEQYPELAAGLQLSEEQAGQFMDLLARQQVELASLIAARPRDIRDGVYSQGLLRDITVMELSDNAEQAALLQDKYQNWLQLQHDNLQRNPIDQLQNRLVQQGAGISDQDMDALNVALAAEQDRIGREQLRDAAPPGQDPRQLLEQELSYAAHRRELVAVAARYLHGRQLEIYEQLLEQRMLNARRLLRTLDAADGE
jgi:hypothetical protein